MKTKKKNNLFTFLCSFVPGCAEMYMGFLKLGVSMLLTFAILAIGCPYVLNIDIIGVLAVIFWFYSFFHARHLASTSQEEFEQLKDNYIWEEFIDSKKLSNEKNNKILAWALIIVGALILWGFISDILRKFFSPAFLNPMLDAIPSVVLSIAIIYIGVMLIRGKKDELKDAFKEKSNGKK